MLSLRFYLRKTRFFLVVLMLGLVANVAVAAKIGDYTVQGVHYDPNDATKSSVILQNNSDALAVQKTYHVGDAIGGYKIVAIGQDDMTVSGERTLYSLNIKSGVFKELSGVGVATATNPSGVVEDLSKMSVGTSPAGLSITADGRAITPDDFARREAALISFMGEDAAKLQMYYENSKLSSIQSKDELSKLMERVEQNMQ